MTAGQLEEIRQLRERLAELERLAQQKGEPMYGNDSTRGKHKVERRDAASARLFRESPEMEQVLAWQRTADPRYAALPAGMKLEAGFYSESKQQAAAHEQRERAQQRKDW
ncbi:hypothetical protein BH24CHL6_BH24CHL6_08770 [soil metagenome]